MSILTIEQKKKYIESGGTHCPICGSSNIRTNDSSDYLDKLFEFMECNDCMCKWTNTYTLDDVDLDD